MCSDSQPPNGLPRLLHYHLGPEATAFSTTRHGGCSEGPYGQLNVNAYCGDEPGHIERNRELLRQALGLSTSDRLIIPHQVHRTKIRLIDEDFLRQPVETRQTELEGFDALMTNVRGICIGVSTADCIPILLYSPERHCAAAIHAGWRGTVARIAQKAVEQLTETFRCAPGQLKAVIGPGISRRNFEVGQEVYDAFLAEGFDMERISIKQAKWHIDLPLCNRLQLESMGIEARNIHDCGICTYDHADEFFSARRLGINSGRIYTGIVLT